jgi:FkbM family methyltransferase
MILKLIRRNSLLNGFIRNALVNLGRSVRFIQSHWRVSGVVNVNMAKVAFKYYSHADDSIADILFYKDRYAEDADIKVFLNLVVSAKTVFDIGANTGLYTVIGGKHAEHSSFYSFEPHPANFNRLQKNVELNDLKNVTLVQKAIGDKDSYIDFYVPKTEGIIDTSSALKDFSETTYGGTISWKPVKVAQTSLDNFVALNSIHQLDLIKIDVEGYEVVVFEGARKTIEKFKPVIICEIFLSEEKRIYFNTFIKEHNYIAYMILSEGLVRLDQDLVQNVSGLNYLFAAIKSDKVFTPFKDVYKLITGKPVHDGL